MTRTPFSVHVTTPKRLGTGSLDADARLRSFRGEIEQGEFTPTEALRRAGQYAHPGWETFQTTKRELARRACNLPEILSCRRSIAWTMRQNTVETENSQ